MRASPQGSRRQVALVTLSCQGDSTTPSLRSSAVGPSDPASVAGDVAGVVTAQNVAPVIVLKTTPEIQDGRIDTTGLVKFNLCDSSDADQRPDDPEAGDTLNWQFHFGDSGLPAFNEDGTFNSDFGHVCRTEHTYEAGRYTATLSVTDQHLEDQSAEVSAMARATLDVEVVVGGPERACSAGGVPVDDQCWYLGFRSWSCDDVCASRGGVIAGCFDWGQCGDAAGCEARLNALGRRSGTLPDHFVGACGPPYEKLGCLYYEYKGMTQRAYCYMKPANSTAKSSKVHRVCACNR